MGLIYKNLEKYNCSFNIGFFIRMALNWYLEAVS